MVTPQGQNPAMNQVDRRCPWCGSERIRLFSRGYTGPTDERDQYFTCDGCGRTTFEIIAKTAREMRLGRYESGGIYRDQINQTRYQISRILKVGVNEFLVYLRPVPEDDKIQNDQMRPSDPPLF